MPLELPDLQDPPEEQEQMVLPELQVYKAPLAPQVQLVQRVRLDQRDLQEQPVLMAPQEALVPQELQAKRDLAVQQERQERPVRMAQQVAQDLLV